MVIFNFLPIFFFTSMLFSAQEFYIVNLDQFPNLGLFASTNQVMSQLYLYETENKQKIAGFKVDFGEYGVYYDPKRGTNWWNYYFEPVVVGSEENARVFPISREEALSVFHKRYRITRKEAASIVDKYIHVKSEILEKIDYFCRLHFLDYYILGVHYRGTDKKIEAPRVPYEVVFKVIEENIPSHFPYLIFVATDEITFLDAIKERFPNKIIFTNSHRTVGDLGVHLVENCPYELGEEALIDCLLLSKSDLLIRTSSNLSLWSTYFNPDLPVILLNKRLCRTKEPE